MKILFLNCYLELELLYHHCLLLQGNACKHASPGCWQGKEGRTEGMKGGKEIKKGEKEGKRRKEKI